MRKIETVKYLLCLCASPKDACVKEKKWRYAPEWPNIEAQREFWVRTDTVMLDDTTAGEQVKIKGTGELSSDDAKAMLGKDGVFADNATPPVPGLADSAQAGTVVKGKGKEKEGEGENPKKGVKKADLCVPEMTEGEVLEDANNFANCLLADLGTLKTLPPQLRSLGGQSELVQEMTESATQMEESYDALIKLIKDECADANQYRPVMQKACKDSIQAKKKIKTGRVILAAIGPKKKTKENKEKKEKKDT